jgi:hypothetical protein
MEITKLACIAAGCFAGQMPQPLPTVPPVPREARPIGLAIQSIVLGWPAHRAGLEIGDTIVEINGESVFAEQDLGRAVQSAAANNKSIDLAIINVRNGEVVHRRIAPRSLDGKLGISVRPARLPAALSIEAVEKHTRELLRRRGLSPAAFQFESIDAKADPLALYLAWESMRAELETALRYELALPEKPALDLVLETKDKLAGHRIALPKQDRQVENLLGRVFGYKADVFLPLKYAVVTLTKRSGEFLPKYRGDDGALNFVEVEVALRNVKRPGNIDDGAMKTLERAGQYIYLRSAWFEAKGLRNGTGRYFYRLKQGIMARANAKDVWYIFVNFDFAWLPLSEHDPERWRTRFVSSDDDPDISNGLTIEVTPKGGMEVEMSRRMIVLLGESSGRNVNSPERVSTLAQVGRTLLRETAESLCGKSK